MVEISWGTHANDRFTIKVATCDLDGIACKPVVHFSEALCPDVWFLEPAIARKLGQALMTAATRAESLNR